MDAWQRTLREIAQPTPRNGTLPLADAIGTHLATDVLAPSDLPDLPVSAMDGYAVRHADLGSVIGAPGRVQRRLPVVLDLPAAADPHRAGRVLPPGSAARIMTGAPLPPGADTVIEVEATDAPRAGSTPSHVHLDVLADTPPGRHVRAVGEEVPRGARLACAGDAIGPGLIALAASLGLRELPVRLPWRIGLVVTGDEVITGGAELGPGAVRDSNADMLAAALGALPGVAESVEVTRSSDDVSELLAVLDDLAPRCDLVVTTGGIGHGAYDVVKAALGEEGRGTSRFAHLALRPGGPQGCGRLTGGTPVVHLPGTPVGALVGFHLFVRPLLAPLGATPAPARVGEVPATPRRASRRGHDALTATPGRLARDPATGSAQRDADGREIIDVVPGRRLLPYGRADRLLLVPGGDPVTGDIVPALDL
ncbi:MAG: molybdopterin molybdotransferase MoeA [Brachybacterium sp.]|nr:molybdopterin molybdotransferase MoeA [Brachybacterium sp.]